MRIKEFIFLFVKSFNPINYKMLTSRKSKDIIWYFFYLILLSVLVGFLFNVPGFIHGPTRLEEDLNKFERFNVTGIDVQLKEPVVLLHAPKIVLDLRENRTLGDETILITDSEIVWRSLRPDILQGSLFGTEEKDIHEYADVLSSAHRLSDMYWILFILFLPSLLFFLLLFNLIKYMIVVLLSFVLVYIIVLMSRKKYDFKKLIKIIVFSLTILVLLDVISPVISIGLWAVLLYMLFLGVNVYVVTNNIKFE